MKFCLAFPASHFAFDLVQHGIDFRDLSPIDWITWIWFVFADLCEVRWPVNASQNLSIINCQVAQRFKLLFAICVTFRLLSYFAKVLCQFRRATQKSIVLIPTPTAFGYWLVFLFTSAFRFAPKRAPLWVISTMTTIGRLVTFLPIWSVLVVLWGVYDRWHKWSVSNFVVYHKLMHWLIFFKWGGLNGLHRRVQAH